MKGLLVLCFNNCKGPDVFEKIDFGRVLIVIEMVEFSGRKVIMLTRSSLDHPPSLG
jgi:hypothetical protein